MNYGSRIYSIILAPMKKNTTDLFVALVPIFFLIAALTFNVSQVFGDAAVDGSNQIILMLSGAVAAGLAMWRKVKFDDIIGSIAQNMSDATKALIILLLIGALSGTWLISGVIPAFVYYGLKLISVQWFLPATLIVSAIVSVSTGSSWSTTATVGIALMSIGEALGVPSPMIAGAVISGAYFGDKMSPMSDTTNLAPTMAGTDLFTHIRYMAFTTIPSISLALIIFTWMSLTMDTSVEVGDTNQISTFIQNKFHITPWLFLVPGLTIVLIIKKVDAIISILIGTLLAGVFAVIFQPQIIQIVSGEDALTFHSGFKAVMTAMYTSIELPSDLPEMAQLLQSKGMAGMLKTVWLIVAAMIFGGAMEAGGFLNIIAKAMVKVATSTASLIGATLATCGFLNITAADQYLAIVVPGRMFKDAYRERGLAPENLSRSLEDSGTVTSVLVPWNTCGAYQSSVLNVATGDYFIYCFFNWISPFMSFIFALFNIRIAKINRTNN